MGPHLHLISFFPVSQFEQLIAKHYCSYMIPLVTWNWCNVKGDETNGASRKYATMAKLQKVQMKSYLTLQMNAKTLFTRESFHLKCSQPQNATWWCALRLFQSTIGPFCTV